VLPARLQTASDGTSRLHFSSNAGTEYQSALPTHLGKITPFGKLDGFPPRINRWHPRAEKQYLKRHAVRANAGFDSLFLPQTWRGL
jgi:hypothetical protein